MFTGIIRKGALSASERVPFVNVCLKLQLDQSQRGINKKTLESQYLSHPSEIIDIPRPYVHISLCTKVNNVPKRDEVI